MSLWKFGICLAIVGVVLTEATSVEIDNGGIKSFDFLSIFPNGGKDLFPKDELKALMYKLSRANRDEGVTIINDYIDNFLEQLNNYIVAEGLDPTAMPDWIELFEWKVILITYKGEISLTKGSLQGLSTLERVGDVTLTSDGQKLKLKMPLTFSKLKFDYHYRAKFMGLGPSGGIDGKITNTKFTINVDVDIASLQAELQSLKVNNKGNISIKFSGNILTDWLVNIFSVVLMPVFKLLFGGVLYDFVNGGVVAIIALYNESVCSIIGTCL